MALITSPDVSHAWECENSLNDTAINFTLIPVGSYNYSTALKKIRIFFL